jgi:hypothetical protein
MEIVREAADKNPSRRDCLAWKAAAWLHKDKVLGFRVAGVLFLDDKTGNRVGSDEKGLCAC